MGLARGCKFIVATAVASLPIVAAAQRSGVPDGGCGATICTQSGVSNWQYEASQYCEADVCLRDTLGQLRELAWDKMTAGQFTLFSTARNPYVGLTNGEYQRLKATGDGDLSERIGLLAKIHTACRPAKLGLRLDVPGYDVVEVTFAIPVNRNNDPGGFQVVQIRRTYRSLPGGSVGWWIRWIGHRFPGIALLEGEPTEFASYEIGLYMGGLVLFDKEFRQERPEEFLAQAACESA